ncbi:MAG: tripartite tricarboxylate transporter substrate-binding protein [Acidaminobacteraceae bacterium]
MKILKGQLGVLVTILLVSSMLITGCTSKAVEDTSTDVVQDSQAEVKYPTKAMEFIAPGGAGGGWDLTIRTVAKVLQDTKLSPVPTPVTNRPGGGGGVNLAYMNEKADSDNIISVYSSPLLLINLNGTSELSYKNTKPLAGLIADYGVFVVAKESKYASITDVLDALKEDPKSVKIGGNSSAGSMDHIQFLMVAKAYGVTNLNQIDYISFQESGVSQILGGFVDVFSTGLGEVSALLESGDLKALAQTADKRIGDGIVGEIPTVMESGIDSTFVNWRGLFAPEEMPEYAFDFWADTIDQLVKTDKWKESLDTNNWDDTYMPAEEFSVFLDKVNEDFKVILEEIGMLHEQ